MYSPAHYKSERLEWILEVLEKHSFATLLTVGGAEISHLPLILDRKQPDRLQLIGHMAKVNSHWQELVKCRKAKAVFHGPHAYISPAWYEPDPGNVPTWNYVAVHVTADFELVGDPAEVSECMSQTVDQFETAYGTSWQMGVTTEVERLLSRIVMFRLTNLDFEAKFKLSQNQKSINRDEVVRQLKGRDSDEARATAEWMEKVLQP